MELSFLRFERDNVRVIRAAKPVCRRTTERGKTLNPEYNIFRDQPIPRASPLRINTLLCGVVTFLSWILYLLLIEFESISPLYRNRLRCFRCHAEEIGTGQDRFPILGRMHRHQSTCQAAYLSLIAELSNFPVVISVGTPQIRCRVQAPSQSACSGTRTRSFRLTLGVSPA